MEACFHYGIKIKEINKNDNYDFDPIMSLYITIWIFILRIVSSHLVILSVYLAIQIFFSQKVSCNYPFFSWHKQACIDLGAIKEKCGEKS